MTPEISTKTPQEILQDDVFLQAKVDLQKVLKLGANLEVKWSKIKQDEVKLSSSFFLGCSAETMEKRESVCVLWFECWWMKCVKEAKSKVQ